MRDTRKYANNTPHFGSQEIAIAMGEWNLNMDEPIPDGAALGIAAQWIAPSGTGEALASLATGFPRAVVDILDDIVDTMTTVFGELHPWAKPGSGKSGWSYYTFAELQAILQWFDHEVSKLGSVEPD